MLWSGDTPDMAPFVPASVIPHFALQDFGMMKATILLKHHCTSVLSSIGWGRGLGMLFARVRRRLIELRSSICNPNLRKCLCLSGHYTLHLSVISSLLQLASEVLHWSNLAGFILCVYFLLVILANKRTPRRLTSLAIWRVQTIISFECTKKGQSVQLALHISTSYVLWQHQMSAPKWTASVQRHTRSNAWEDEARLSNGPAEPGLWTCIVNAATGPSAKTGLDFSPRTCSA